MKELFLFPCLQEDDALKLLKEELEHLKNILTELELQITTLKKNLSEFEILYRNHLSEHYARLDSLKLDLLQLLGKYQKGLVSAEELQEARSQAQRSNQEYHERFSDEAAIPQFKPTETLKELYRKAVKQMHPDLGNTHEEKVMRTALLSQINEAYAHGNEEGIREILHHWQEGNALNLDTGSETAIVYRRILFANKGIQKIEAELYAIRRGKSYELWQAYQAARSEGHNLLEEIAKEIIQETVDILTKLKELAR